jgi:hypothetical protein
VTVPADNSFISYGFEFNLSSTATEIAEIGFWASVDAETPADSAAWDTFLQALATFAVDQWHTSMPQDHFCADLSLSHVKAVHYDSAGHTLNEKQATPSSSWAGTGGAALPWQIAQVIGLYSYTPGTFISNARQRRGRVYLPGLSSALMAASGGTGGSGLLDVTKAEAMRDGVNDLLNAIYAHFVGGSNVWTPCVFSRVGSHLWPITDLTTDVKADTQRRRTNKLDVARLSVEAEWI